MRIIFDGEKAFAAYKQLLASAEKEIWLCMYMIRFDEYTKQLFEILDEKHAQGVRVTVWYDGFGCFRSIPRLATREYCKMFVPRITRLNTRNHAKMMMIDGQQAIVSGRNLTKKYYQKWQDASIILSDKKHLHELKRFTKRIEQTYTEDARYDGVTRVTDPLMRHRSVYHFFLEHIAKSQKEIIIASPYFVIDDAVESLLKAAADKGVKITIIVPAKPEHRLARTFNRINFQRIHHKNVTVMRSAGMFHTKAMVFDDIALVGSANFDNRSFKYAMELSVVIEKKHVWRVKKHLEEVADHSVKYNWIQRTYDTLLFHLTRHLMELL